MAAKRYKRDTPQFMILDFDRFCKLPEVQDMNDHQLGLAFMLYVRSFFQIKPLLLDDDKKLQRWSGSTNMRDWLRNKGVVLTIFKPFECDGRTYWGNLDVIKSHSDVMGVPSPYHELVMDVPSAYRETTLNRCGSTNSGTQSHPDQNATETEIEIEEEIEQEKEKKRLEGDGDLSSKLDSHSLSLSSSNTEADMTFKKAKKQINTICIDVLGMKAEGDWSNCWKDIQTYCGTAVGGDGVVEAFTAWAEEIAATGESVNGYPISAFCKVAPGLIGGQRIALSDSALTALIDDMVSVSKGDIGFNFAHQRIVGTLLKRFTADEILTTFRLFYDTVDNDPKALKYAAKDFCEKAAGLTQAYVRERDRQRRNEEKHRELEERSFAEGRKLVAEVLARPDEDEEQLAADDPLNN